MHHQSRIIILSIVLATIHTSQAANQEQVLEDYLLSVVRALKGPRRIEPSTDAPEDEMKTQTVGQLQSEAVGVFLFLESFILLGLCPTRSVSKTKIFRLHCT